MLNAQFVSNRFAAILSQDPAEMNTMYEQILELSRRKIPHDTAKKWRIAKEMADAMRLPNDWRRNAENVFQLGNLAKTILANRFYINQHRLVVGSSVKVKDDGGITRQICEITATGQIKLAGQKGAYRATSLIPSKPKRKTEKKRNGVHAH